MKKNELVHLHALLARVAADYRERGLVTDADLEPYRAVGVGPSSLTESRSEHRRAVRALLSILAAHSDTDSDATPDEPDRPGDAAVGTPDRSEAERPTGNH